MKKLTRQIIDDCGCDDWVEAFVEELCARAKINAEEITIYDMDGSRIYLQAEVWDETIVPEETDEETDEGPGGWVDKTYTIRYYEDDVRLNRLILSYVFYDNKRVTVEEKRPDGSISRYDAPITLDEGAYKIVSRLGKIKCIRLKDE